MKPTQGEIARHLDLSIRGLREVYARGDVDKTADLDTQRVQYIRRLRAVASNRAPTGKLDPQQERALKDREIRLGLAQKRLKEAGKLCWARDAFDYFNAEIVNAKAELLGVPARVAPTVAGMADRRAVEEVLRDHVYEVLTRLATGIERKAFRLFDGNIPEEAIDDEL